MYENKEVTASGECREWFIHGVKAVDWGLTSVSARPNLLTEETYWTNTCGLHACGRSDEVVIAACCCCCCCLGGRWSDCFFLVSVMYVLFVTTCGPVSIPCRWSVVYLRPLQLRCYLITLHWSYTILNLIGSASVMLVPFCGMIYLTPIFPLWALPIDFFISRPMGTRICVVEVLILPLKLCAHGHVESTSARLGLWI